MRPLWHGVMLGEPTPLDLSREGADWPNREASRLVEAGGLRWHVQETGEGPCVLLVHGTGASTHSWRDVMPELARHFRVVAMDLPGHGFTRSGTSRMQSLRGMAHALRALLAAIDARPQIAVGHSSGAAILAAMTLEDATFRPDLIISLNGALLPIRGSRLFAPLAMLMAANPLVPRLFSLRARSPSATRRVIEGTGSLIDARGLELYARLFRNPAHVAGTLAMMANWELDWLKEKLPALQVPLLLVSARGDKAVPPSDARQLEAIVPNARLMSIPGGHLAHEENPGATVELIMAQARLVDLL